MMNDPLANAMASILNAEQRSRKSCIIAPASSLIRKALEIMNKHGYIGAFTEQETPQGTALQVNLIGGINKCGAVKPQHSVKNKNFEKYEKKYLPARDFGFILVSTSQGVMTHSEAKQKALGGKLIAYFY